MDRLHIRALQGRGVSTIYKGSRRANYTVIQRSNKYEILAGPVPCQDYGHLNGTIYMETGDFAGT